MKILLCHTHYQQRGGEDESFAAEARMLAEHGHEVIRYTRHNEEMAEMGRLRAAATTVWNRSLRREVRDVIRRERPDVMHCTNTFPLLSPSVYYAAKSEGVPVVQSLRNYRQLCPSATFLRDGRVCEDCLGKAFAWPGVAHACYRGSRLATAVVAATASIHHAIGTWSRAVDLYFTPSEFAKDRFVAAGWPADKIRVKPNFLSPDPGIGAGHGGYALFVGRLSEEKGIAAMFDAWERLASPVPLKIVGSGPLAEMVSQFAALHPHVEYLGPRNLNEVLELVGDARMLVMPSIWYETFGRTIMEAMAKGTPVIASRLGAMAELVEPGVTGLTFTPGDAAALAACVTQLDSDPALQSRMRLAARYAFEQRYTATHNHDLLVNIYEEAITRRPALQRKASLAAPRSTLMNKPIASEI